jgi:N-acetylneuraminic acid mutarotase
MKQSRRYLNPLLVAVSCALVAACHHSSTVAPVTLPIPVGGNPTGTWTWVGGANVVGVMGTYGSLGQAAPGNTPGSRAGSLGWADAVGNLWLFGGLGYDASGNGGDLNDLWAFSIATGQWTWVSGSSTVNVKGVYGAVGVAAATNLPGARESGVSWIDAAGNLWLFGGAGYDSAGTAAALNDVWEFSPATGQWTWIGGSSTVNASGTYGTLGAAAAGNMPGAREVAVSWVDASGNLWVFGGTGYDSVGASGDLNDLWEFSPATGLWTWVSGASTVNAKGLYGTAGTAAAGNVPGARYASVSWIDAAGNLWLMGGSGYDSAGTNGYLNDLWKFSPATQQWTWVSGAGTVNAVGNYGTESTPAASNVPGGRQAPVSWTDAAGNLWLAGGVGYDSTGTTGYLNDLWKFVPGTGQWTWMNGAATANGSGAYGTKGTGAAANGPGSRFGARAWTDASGDLWLFGGQGADSAGSAGYLNDLWKFVP